MTSSIRHGARQMVPCCTVPFTGIPTNNFPAVQGPSLKLILIPKPNSNELYLQIEWAGALFLPWGVGNNFISCHFYDIFRFHAQKKGNVKSTNFPLHAPHVFPLLREPKSARIAVVKVVGFAFRIISKKRDKILSWNFDMTLVIIQLFKSNFF